jgi:rhodanese-related sulfurtransferase
MIIYSHKDMIEIKCKTISPVALFELSGARDAHELLDVRTSPEYASAHIPRARLIPLNELNVEMYLRQHMPGTPIYVVCQAGARAAKAIEQFEHAGCGDAILVEGGTQAWIDAGLPVHRGSGSVLPIMRQVQIVVGSLSSAGAILVLTVDRWFAVVPLFLGFGLLFAGVSGTCGMALLLARMPWNQGRSDCAHCADQE